MLNLEEIRHKLRRLRHDGVLVSEMAQDMGLHVDTLYKIERGEREPGYRVYIALNNYLIDR